MMEMRVLDLVKWLSQFLPDDEVRINQQTLTISRRKRNGSVSVIAHLNVNRRPRTE